MDARPENPVPVESPLATTRILVVDNNKTVRNGVADALEFIGDSPTPEKADSGSEALELLEKAKETKAFDIVITDLNMPGMSGVELAQAIQEGNLVKMGTLIMTMNPDQISPEQTQQLIDQGIVAAILPKSGNFTGLLLKQTTELAKSANKPPTANP